MVLPYICVIFRKAFKNTAYTASYRVRYNEIDSTLKSLSLTKKQVPKFFTCLNIAYTQDMGQEIIKQLKSGHHYENTTLDNDIHFYIYTNDKTEIYVKTWTRKVIEEDLEDKAIQKIAKDSEALPRII